MLTIDCSMLPDDTVIQLVQEFIEVHKRWWPSPGSGPTDPRALFDDVSICL